MKNYKAPDNTIHCISQEFAYMLPAGCVEITEEEANALRPKPPQPTYADLRRAEYPPITDYIDGIVKGDQAQIDAYVNSCLAVKAKYPKE